jgi:hypothetical protein
MPLVHQTAETTWKVAMNPFGAKLVDDQYNHEANPIWVCSHWSWIRPRPIASHSEKKQSEE